MSACTKSTGERASAAQKSRHIVIDGKEYTEFTSFKGKPEGALVRVPRRKCAAKHAHVVPGELLVGPICQSKHGKRRVMLRRRADAPGKGKGGSGSLLHASNMRSVVSAQKNGGMIHFVDDDSKGEYRRMLYALSHGVEDEVRVEKRRVRKEDHGEQRSSV